MFLSQLLTDVEQNYWPTELEIAGFVWVIKKIRYLVKSLKYKVMIQIDHSAIVDIVKQCSIVSITSTIQMNLRLVRALQFLCRFDLGVCHKSGKENIVPDALLQLASTNTGKLLRDYNKLDVLTTIDVQFTATLVRMNNEFQKQILNSYKENN